MSKFTRLRDMVHSQIMVNEPVPPALCTAYNDALKEIDPSAFDENVYFNMEQAINSEIRRIEVGDGT